MFKLSQVTALAIGSQHSIFSLVVTARFDPVTIDQSKTTPYMKIKE